MNEKISERANLTWFYPRICNYQDKLTDHEAYFQFLNEKEQEDKKVLLYIHVPFCDSLCAYCACFKELSGKYSYEEKKKYVQMLVSEMEFYGQKAYFQGKKINYIQFGGGTPSCLDIEFFEMIFEGIHANFELAEDCNVSLEGNVMSLKNMDKLKALKRLGVDRLSFGLQTFNEEIRKSLGIKAKVEEIYEATKNIRAAGFTSLAVDLMYNLPNETVDILKHDIEIITRDIKPDYIQTYRFNQFYNTVLYQKIQDGFFENPPSCEKEIIMSELIMDALYENGYRNQMLVNMFSNQEIPILTGLEYTMGFNQKNSSVVLGIGPGASSYLSGRNYRSVCSIKEYIERVEHHQIPSDAGNVSSEQVQASRLMVFFPNFTKIKKSELILLEGYQEKIEALKNHGYVEETEDELVLTKKGKLWAGDISSDFFAPEEVLKLKRSVYYSMKDNTNPFNQDKMNTSNESKLQKVKNQLAKD